MTGSPLPFDETRAESPSYGQTHPVTDARVPGPVNCFGCRRGLVPGEPMWVRIRGEVACARCVPEAARHSYRQTVCRWCVRPIHVRGVMRAFCAGLCASRFRNRVVALRGTVARQRACVACQQPFVARRADARSCGDRCRQRLHRRRVQEVA
jgi:hypothetical protein